MTNEVRPIIFVDCMETLLLPQKEGIIVNTSLLEILSEAVGQGYTVRFHSSSSEHMVEALTGWIRANPGCFPGNLFQSGQIVVKDKNEVLETVEQNPESYIVFDDSSYVLPGRRDRVISVRFQDGVDVNMQENPNHYYEQLNRFGVKLPNRSADNAMVVQQGASSQNLNPAP